MILKTQFFIIITNFKIYIFFTFFNNLSTYSSIQMKVYILIINSVHINTVKNDLH